jgi:hypothetical protein
MKYSSEQITALIPTFQRNTCLERAVRGVLNQQHKNTIINIFDNDPQNQLTSTLKQLIENTPNINYTRNERNIGSLSNFKKCFESVETPFFSIQSDDDFILPNFYMDALKIFERFPTIGFVVFESLIVNRRSELVVPAASTGKISLNTTDRPIFISSVPNTWTSMLFRKEIAPIFAEAVVYPSDIGSDMRCVMRAMSRYDFVVVAKPAACFTAHQGSTSSSRASVEEGTPYHIVQLTRHVDVIMDPHVCEEQRDFHRALLHSLRKKNLRPIWMRIILVDIVREWVELDDIDYSNRLDKNCNAFINNENGGIIGSALMHARKNSLLRALFRFFLRRLLLLRRKKWRDKMCLLENGKYSHIFSLLREVK